MVTCARLTLNMYMHVVLVPKVSKLHFVCICARKEMMRTRPTNHMCIMQEHIGTDSQSKNV